MNPDYARVWGKATQAFKLARPNVNVWSPFFSAAGFIAHILAVHTAVTTAAGDEAVSDGDDAGGATSGKAAGRRARRLLRGRRRPRSAGDGAARGGGGGGGCGDKDATEVGAPASVRRPRLRPASAPGDRRARLLRRAVGGEGALSPPGGGPDDAPPAATMGAWPLGDDAELGIVGDSPPPEAQAQRAEACSPAGSHHSSPSPDTSPARPASPPECPAAHGVAPALLRPVHAAASAAATAGAPLGEAPQPFVAEESPMSGWSAEPEGARAVTPPASREAVGARAVRTQGGRLARPASAPQRRAGAAGGPPCSPVSPPVPLGAGLPCAAPAAARTAVTARGVPVQWLSSVRPHSAGAGRTSVGPSASAPTLGGVALGESLARLGLPQGAAALSEYRVPGLGGGAVAAVWVLPAAACAAAAMAVAAMRATSPAPEEAVDAGAWGPRSRRPASAGPASDAVPVATPARLLRERARHAASAAMPVASPLQQRVFALPPLSPRPATAGVPAKRGVAAGPAARQRDRGAGSARRARRRSPSPGASGGGAGGGGAGGGGTGVRVRQDVLPEALSADLGGLVIRGHARRVGAARQQSLLV